MPSALAVPANPNQQQSVSTASSTTLPGGWSTRDGGYSFAQVENMDASNQVCVLSIEQEKLNH